MILALLLIISPLLAELPREIDIIAKNTYWTRNYLLYSQSSNLAQVKKEFFTWFSDYELYTPESECLAFAQKEIFTFGILFTIKDNIGETLCKIEERIFRVLPTFDIISPDGEKWIEAQMNYWGTLFTLSNPKTKEVVATLSRPFFSFTDDWQIIIYDNSYLSTIDWRILYLGLVLQADYLHWSKYPAHNSEQSQIVNKHPNSAWINSYDMELGNMKNLREVKSVRQYINGSLGVIE